MSAEKAETTLAVVKGGFRGPRTLAGKFLTAGAIVIVSGMLIIGFWVTAEIEEGVTRNTAASTAFYMESVIAPLVQELATARRLSEGARQALDKTLGQTELARRIVSFKIWKEGGYIAYSSQPAIVGRTFPVTANLRGAWQGEVTAEFDSLRDKEDRLERAQNQPLLEMYSPVRERKTGRIIAVVEFYEIAGMLRANLSRAYLKSWLVVATVSLAMFGALSGIVLRGSRTIESQRSQLQGRVEELSALLKQNEDLRTRLQNASNRVAEINERYLRRIGADLHDGPAQLIGFALLRLDALQSALTKRKPAVKETAEIDAVHDALREALGEIRALCAGLTLAKLEEMSPVAVLREIVTAHEKRTGSSVALDITSAPGALPVAIKISVFRFVQEALNNAYRHAGGRGQKVKCRQAENELTVEVSDEGPGIAPDAIAGGRGRLGLAGLRERIESLGGSLDINSSPGKGTTLVMRCNINQNQ